MDKFERNFCYFFGTLAFVIWCVMWIIFAANNIIHSNPAYPWHSTTLLIHGGGLCFWALMLIAGLIWVGHSYFKKNGKNKGV